MPKPQVPPPAQVARIPSPTLPSLLRRLHRTPKPAPVPGPLEPAPPLRARARARTKAVARARHRPSSLAAGGSSAPSSTKAGAPHLAPALRGSCKPAISSTPTAAFAERRVCAASIAPSMRSGFGPAAPASLWVQAPLALGRHAESIHRPFKSFVTCGPLVPTKSLLPTVMRRLTF